MNFVYISIINLSLLLVLFLVLKKLNLLNDKINTSKHKEIGKINNKPILLGGLYFAIIFTIFFVNQNLNLKLTLIFIFLLGLLSDINFVNNVKLRFLTQSILTLSLVIFSDLKIIDLRIGFLNQLLEINTFNVLFTTFCLIILINGSNFIDGLNTLLGGYLLLILLCLIYLKIINNDLVMSNFFNIIILTISLVFFLILNFTGKVYFGDSGSYFLSALIGFILIDLYYVNTLNMSPYYIALLLWYPAFENLFSLIRRLNFKKRISHPDNLHLHHLTYQFILDKGFFEKKNVNQFSSLIILFFNLPSIIIGTLYFQKTKIIIFLIFCNILLYLFFYIKVLSPNNKK
jgi:UDP-N-acetylmuramyl pentapeptide phosphotransferase/UDP-N-acetylglucosamine-1-phosphate transferase